MEKQVKDIGIAASLLYDLRRWTVTGNDSPNTSIMYVWYTEYSTICKPRPNFVIKKLLYISQEGMR